MTLRRFIREQELRSSEAANLRSYKPARIHQHRQSVVSTTSTSSTSSTLGWVKALPVHAVSCQAISWHSLFKATLVLPCLDHADGAAKPFWRTNLGLCNRRPEHNRSCSRSDLSPTRLTHCPSIRESLGRACSSFCVCMPAPLVDDLDFRVHGHRRSFGIRLPTSGRQP